MSPRGRQRLQAVRVADDVSCGACGRHLGTVEMWASGRDPLEAPIELVRFDKGYRLIVGRSRLWVWATHRAAGPNREARFLPIVRGDRIECRHCHALQGVRDLKPR